MFSLTVNSILLLQLGVCFLLERVVRRLMAPSASPPSVPSPALRSPWSPPWAQQGQGHTTVALFQDFLFPEEVVITLEDNI